MPSVIPGTSAVVDESATNSLTVAIVRLVGDIELTSAELEAYQGLFKLTFSPGAETGKVNVGAELDETKTGGVVTSLNAASSSIPLATVAAGTDAEVTVNVVPGLFYGVSNGTSLQGMSVAADGWTQAVSGQTTVTLTVPAQAAGSGSGFYRIEAVAVPPPTLND